MTVLGVHPARLDLAVHAGDVIDFTVPIVDGSGVAETDLSGWACTATATGPSGSVLHTFTAVISSALVHVTASAAVTATWLWADYAARLVVTATPPGADPVPIGTGWIRLYRP